MEYWSWWVSGLALAVTMLVHWVVSGRMMAVSGRVTTVVNRLRFGPDEPAGDALSEAELLAAIEAATLAEFGEASLEANSAENSCQAEDDETHLVDDPDEAAAEVTDKSPAPGFRLVDHAVFFGCLVVGGWAAAAWSGTGEVVWPLRSEFFDQVSMAIGGMGPGVLLVGGSFVGFGTRMAGGCTSGHGLCGLSRFQAGSAVATASFFGAGIVTAFALRFVLGLGGAG